MNRQACLLAVFYCLFNQITWGMESLPKNSLAAMFSSRYQNMPKNPSSLTDSPSHPALTKIQQICFLVRAKDMEGALTDLLFQSDLEKVGFANILLADERTINIFDIAAPSTITQKNSGYQSIFYCEDGSLLSLYDWLSCLVKAADFLHATKLNVDIFEKNYQFLKKLLEPEERTVSGSVLPQKIEVNNSISSPTDRYIEIMKQKMGQLKLESLYEFMEKFIEKNLLLNHDLLDKKWLRQTFKNLQLGVVYEKRVLRDLCCLNLYIITCLEKMRKNNNGAEKNREFIINFVIDGARNKKFILHTDHVNLLDRLIHKQSLTASSAPLEKDIKK